MPSSTNHSSSHSPTMELTGSGSEDVFGVGMTDDELSSLNIKDLNRKLKERGLPKVTIEKIKQRRRTLKNRKYATDCREKKDVEVHNLEGTKESESTTLTSMQAENEKLREGLYNIKGHYNKLIEFAAKNHIELKRRNVPGVSASSAGQAVAAAPGPLSTSKATETN